jgi:tRNA threonylcarbamoyladenosine biosynthesis protein TsaE
MLEIITNSAEETKEFGEKLGIILKAGDIICLNGDLGTGKTALTNGIAAGMDIKGYITSPTFTIVNEYAGRIPLYHFDVYRIADSEEMFEIGFEEYLNGNGVVVIEWAEQIRDILPDEYLWVHVQKRLDIGLDTRAIKLDFVGKRYEELERELIRQGIK